MLTMEDLRREAEANYRTFSAGILVATSRAFGIYVRRRMDVVAEHSHVIEVREIDHRYQAGCLQQVRLICDGVEVSQQFN